jgi:hypothetical protein
LQDRALVTLSQVPVQLAQVARVRSSPVPPLALVFHCPLLRFGFPQHPAKSHSHFSPLSRVPVEAHLKDIELENAKHTLVE